MNWKTIKGIAARKAASEGTAPDAEKTVGTLGETVGMLKKKKKGTLADALRERINVTADNTQSEEAAAYEASKNASDSCLRSLRRKLYSDKRASEGVTAFGAVKGILDNVYARGPAAKIASVLSAREARKNASEQEARKFSFSERLHAAAKTQRHLKGAAGVGRKAKEIPARKGAVVKGRTVTFSDGRTVTFPPSK